MNWLEGVLTYFILLFKLGPVSFAFVNFTTDNVLIKGICNRLPLIMSYLLDIDLAL